MPESLNSACRPVFAGTCSIGIDTENFDVGWQIPVHLALNKASRKISLMKDLDDRLWSHGDQTISAIPTHRDHIPINGSRPALGQIKSRTNLSWCA